MSSTIETITTSDNIKKFMDKCNHNFNLIVEMGGGPRGRDGATGETGATGKRGNKFHYVPINTDVPFGPEEATEALSNVEDLEDGDFVFFFVQNECAYAAFVEFEETSEGFVPVITSETLISLQGPQGIQGIPGDASSDQFEADGDVLTLRNPFQQIILPKPDEGQLLSQPSNTLCIVRGGIGFVSGDSEKSAIKSDTDTGEFTISSELNISLASTQNVSIGDNGNGVSQNVILTGKNININSDGTTNRITLDQNNIKIFGNAVFDNGIQVSGNVSATGNISATQKITTPTVETNAISVTNLGSLGSVKVNNVDGFNVGDGAFRVMSNSQKKVSIGSVVECANTIKAKVGNDNLYLGVPKFTFMLYPKNANTPSGWVDFTNAIAFTPESEVNYTNQATHSSGNYLYFKYNVSTSSGNQMKYVKVKTSNINTVSYAFELTDSLVNGTNSSSGSTTYTTGDGTITITPNNYRPTGSSSSSGTSGLSGLTEVGTASAPDVMFGGGSSVAGGEDYIIDIDGGDVPWAPVIPDTGTNYYALLIKHMLTNKSILQDMSNVFSRFIIRTGGSGASLTTTTQYTLPVPTVPSSMFKWIFKVS